MQRGQKVDIFGKARVNVRLSDVWRARFNYHDGHFDFFFFPGRCINITFFYQKLIWIFVGAATLPAFPPTLTADWDRSRGGVRKAVLHPPC